jgi:glycosyl hydrolase family 42 (putative beta-galactosidase)
MSTSSEFGQAPRPDSPAWRRTRWGGIAESHFTPSGFFRIEQQRDRFWLVDPLGGKFISKGINTVRLDQDTILNTNRVPYSDACLRKYRDRSAWRRAIANRMLDWGFNTLGCWSDEVVAYVGYRPLAITPTIDVAKSFHLHQAEQHFPDVFDPQFDAHVRQSARRLCSGWQRNPNILGIFTDNELHWSPNGAGNDELLTQYLNLPPRRPGRSAAIDFLQQRYANIESLNAIWQTPARSWEQFANLDTIKQPYLRPPFTPDEAPERRANQADPKRAAFSADSDAFAGIVADRYFDITVSAIKEADPNHLILGCRFRSPPGTQVLSAAASYLDVISFNFYGFDPSAQVEYYARTGRPCLISEFSFRAGDSGLPNTVGAGPVVTDQRERAQCFDRYVATALRSDTVVGYHWFEHADEPREGRHDGENSNYGIVTIADAEYQEFVPSLRNTNGRAELNHEGSVPTALS